MKPFRTVVILLLLIALGVFGAQWLAQQPARDLGEVFVRFGGYDYSTTGPRALLALALAFFGLWLLARLLALPFRVWRRHRRRQARARLIEGLAALQAGHWQRAERLLERAAQDPEAGALAEAGRVRAADARGDAEAALRHLQALAGRDPALAALLAAERALAAGDPRQALATLDDPALQPPPPRGLALRAQALAEAGRAGEAYGLLGALRQQQALSPTTLAALEARLAAQSLAEAGDANVLAERWEAMPKPLRSDAAVVAAYARRAAALRWDDAAAHSLEHALDERWDEDLALLYGRLPLAKPDARRASAQHWLQAHPASPGLLVSLALLARRQGQWTQAQEFLHRALAQGAGAEAWEALGDGLAEAGDDALARLSYANALRAERGEPAQELPGRDMRQRIHDEAVMEDRDTHGFPRLSD